MPERIRALIGKRAADLTRRDLLDIAADAANRDPWDLCGDREHVGAICDLAGTLEAEIDETRAELHNALRSAVVRERTVAQLEAQLEALIGAGAALPDQHTSGALEAMLTTGPDDPGPHDAVTVDCAIDEETRVATDEDMA